MKIVNDDLLFESTGRKDYANGGIVGLARRGEFGYGRDGVSVFGGFDQNLPCQEFDKPYTLAERRELADYMIALWMEYRGKEV